MRPNVLRSALTILSFALTLIGFPPTAAEAATITLNPTARGCYNASGAFACGGSGTPIAFYAAGEASAPSFVELRNFFVFDLSGVTGTISAASMTFELNPFGYASPDGSETFVLFDYAGSITALAGGAAGAAGFADLGSGVSYATRNYSAADNGQTIVQPLSATAVANLNAAIGASWALGGALATLGNPTQEAVFGGSDSRLSQLTLTTVAVPEPASLVLLSSGLVALALRSRRQRRPGVRRSSSES